MEEAFETKGAIKDEYPDQLDDSEEEKEDFTIRKSDGIIVTATAESDHSNLEVYVYDYTTSDLYVHHEIILSSYPLCLEWLPVHGGQKVNYMIVGTFLPEIEIWDLDTEDCEPVGILGSVEQSEKYKKKSIKQFNKSKKVLNPEQTHTDAVLSISLNPFQKEYLASGSADKTIKIWDLDDF
jgi:periodic tryptophan protein 1